MSECLKVHTLNVRGIGCKRKSREMLIWLKDNYKGIIFLQETHGNEERKEYWEELWEGPIYCSHGNTNSRGVAILIPNALDYKFENTICDKIGVLSFSL